MDAAERRYLHKRIVAFAGMWVFACLFLWQARALPPPSRPTPVAASTFPTIVGIAMVIAATGMLAGAIWALLRARSTDPVTDEDGMPKTITSAAEEDEHASSGPNGEEVVNSVPRLLIALGATAAYIAVFFPLGYALSTALFLAGMTAFFWRKPLRAVAIALALTVAIAWLFSLLGITLPPGLLALPL